jgi:hypothetical protein
MTKLTRYDDLNLASLNLIVALDTVDMREWQVQYELQERIVKVSCRAMPEYLVPHGLDNDVTTALINLYLEQGEPTDGTLSVSGSQLLRLCGWHHNGKYLKLLKESLERLHTSSFTVSGGWRDHPNRRWTHASFHFIERLSFSSSDGEGRFDNRSMITLRLAEDITASIHSGYIKPLDTDFMSALSRPRTRVLYRVLDAARFDLEHPEVQLGVLDVNVLEWADQCKIPSRGEAWRVIKALEGPHQDLIKRGYLRDVVVTGRGREQRIRYEFAREYTPMDPVLTRRFRTYGVADGVARRLAREQGRDVLIACMDRFDALVRTQVLVVKKSTAAALIHLIQHPDDYPYPAVDRLPAPAKANQMDPLFESPPTDPTLQFQHLDPDQAADRLVTYLSPHYKKLLNVGDLDALRHAVVSGKMEAGQVAREGIAAVARMDRAAFVAALREQLTLKDGEDGS